MNVFLENEFHRIITYENVCYDVLVVNGVIEITVTTNNNLEGMGFIFKLSDYDRVMSFKELFDEAVEIYKHQKKRILEYEEYNEN